MAIIISISIYLLREFSKYAVAKYTIDTDAPILRRGRINLRQTTRVISSITVTPLSRLAKYYRFRNYIPEEEVFEKEEREYGWIKYIPGVIAILIFIVLIYYSVKLIVSIPMATWNYLFSITPFIILNMLFDYIRIAIIAIVSLIFAILLGYYLAMRKRGEAILVPIIQTFSAFPPPIYFPIVFGISYPFVLHYFGFLATEIYVLAIGFVSTFYYALYSFWMGFKAFPGEYFDVMENFQMNFFQKLRYIILPGTFPYLISGMTSTINSAWGGLMIGEYWPDIIGDKSLEVKVGLMKYISQATLQGNIEIAAWSSFIFSIVVVLYSLFFTKKLMDLASKKYVAEEGIYAA
jgi:ABC-type anion transport system, duplicated permease component